MLLQVMIYKENGLKTYCGHREVRQSLHRHAQYRLKTPRLSMVVVRRCVCGDAETPISIVLCGVWHAENAKLEYGSCASMRVRTGI